MIFLCVLLGIIATIAISLAVIYYRKWKNIEERISTFRSQLEKRKDSFDLSTWNNPKSRFLRQAKGHPFNQINLEQAEEYLRLHLSILDENRYIVGPEYDECLEDFIRWGKQKKIVKNETEFHYPPDECFEQLNYIMHENLRRKWKKVNPPFLKF